MKKAVILIIALLLLFSFLASIIAMAQQGAAVATSEPASLKATEEILKVVANLRELPVKQPVKSGAKTRDQIKESVIKDLSESNTPEEVEASSKTLKRLGLLPKDFKLREYMISLLAEQVAGYYDPKSQFFYLASWIPIAEQKTVIAHELVHALQDQHFNLRRFEKWKKGDADAETAAHALAEGEATIVMYQYEFAERGMKFDITRLPSLTEVLLSEGVDNDGGKFPVLAKAPNALKESLQFPYFYGAGFVQAVLKKGSWKTLDEAYTQLPASTEQIIHPEKYLAKEAPVKIELADLSSALGRDWKQIESDINGEFGYNLILAEYTPKAEARAAAAGWGGDRYATYEDKKTGDVMVAQFTSWDTAGDAEAFADAYAARTEKRYTIKPLVGLADLVDLPQVYQTPDGFVAVQHRDKDVVIIEGARTKEQLIKLLPQLWKSKKL